MFTVAYTGKSAFAPCPALSFSGNPAQHQAKSRVHNLLCEHCVRVLTLEVFGVLNIDDSYSIPHAKCGDLEVHIFLLGDTTLTSVAAVRHSLLPKVGLVSRLGSLTKCLLEPLSSIQWFA